MWLYDVLSIVLSAARKRKGVLETRAKLLWAASLFVAAISMSANAQVPILYYDFENNTTRTIFENIVEQAVNSGSGAITRAGNTMTITSVSGAGVFNGGAANGQAAAGSNWDSSTIDTGAAATNYYQFAVNTDGFSQISISFDNQASATGPARIGLLYSTDGANFVATTTGLTGNAAFSSATFDLSGISAIDNHSSVTIRLYAFAGSAGDRTGRSAFSSAGTFRIDNLTVVARKVTGSKTLLDYPSIGLSIRSGAAFTPTYTDFTVDGSGIAVALASEVKVSGTFNVLRGALNCGSNSVSGEGTFVLASAAEIGIGSVAGISSSGGTGNIQTLTRNFDTGASYTYNGSSAQVTGNGLPSIVNLLTINNNAGVSLSSDLIISGTLTLTAGTFSIGPRSLTLNNPIVGTVNNLNADSLSSITVAGSSSGIVIPGSVTTINNLVVDNPNGTTLLGNITIGGTLELTSGDLNTGSFTLYMGNDSTSTGNGDVVGNVNRSDVGATTRIFGNPNVQITITDGNVTAMTMNLVKESPSDFANSVRRTYSITDVVGTLITSTVRFRYLDSELNGNSEETLELWRKDGSSWISQGADTRDSTNNWVEKHLVTSFSDWTIAGPTGPTDIAMVSYSARQQPDGKVLLQWETGEEVNNLGFNIYREEGGQRVRLNGSLIVGSGLMAKPGTVMTAGRSYNWRTWAASGKHEIFWIEEIDVGGRTMWHGPVRSQMADNEIMAVKAEKPSLADQALTLEDLAKEGKRSGTVPVHTSTPVRADNTNLQHLAFRDAIKITAREEGLYRIGKPELVSAGLDTEADPRSLQLFVDGFEVPITVNTYQGAFDSRSTVEFYAEALDTPETDRRVYWLISAKTTGKRITTPPEQSSIPSSNSFLYTVERRDRSIYISGIRNGEEENFFGTPVGSELVYQTITLQHLDSTETGEAILEVGLQGFSLTPHMVAVSLNGNPIGTMAYNAQTKGFAQFTVPNNMLTEGENLVTLRAQQGVLDVSLVDHIRVSYWHRYSADDNALGFRASANQQITIGGFDSGEVKVLDVTNPREPLQLLATVNHLSAGYAVTFAVSGTGTRTILAIGADRVRNPESLQANRPSTLRNPGNQADLLIITHRSFERMFDELAAIRRSHGLKVSIVDIEDIYDEFNFGTRSTQAIKDFLSYTTTSWSRTPRYVLLAGTASYDPKNYNGLGAYDLVPTRLVDTEFMETASDDWFADFNLDGIAEMAIGRLPVHTSEEASGFVMKLLAYETSPPQSTALLVADDSLGFDFEAANSQLAVIFPARITVQQINRGQVGTAAAKQHLLDGIASGQKIVNYVGHGSPGTWRNNLLTAGDAFALTNHGRYPLFVAMTCLNGLFQHPELNALAPALMNAPHGGAIAVWASSGLTEPRAQATMNQQFYKAMFQFAFDKRDARGLTLGDLTVKAKSSVLNADIRRTWILFGDPSMMLK